jgi:uncharacterized protein (DUF58 family)
LDVTRRLDGLLHGNYRGLVPGHGTEPGEARPYEPGDDVRQIDWNVTARTAATHIRESIAERELETWVVVDRSASLDFGTAQRSKSDLALAATAAVGFLTAHGGNRNGAIIGGSGATDIVPARQGRQHVLGILHRVAAPIPPGAPTGGLAPLLNDAAGVARRRGLVVVISDFLDDPSQWAHPLGRLAVRHELLAIEVSDPREHELPNAGVVGLVDAETGAVIEVNTSRADVRERFAAAASARVARVHDTLAAAGADHLRLRTDGDWLLEVARHVSTRRRRRANISAIGPRP